MMSSKTAQVFQRPMQQRFHCGDTQIIMCSGFRQAHFAQMDMLHNGSLAGGELAQIARQLLPTIPLLRIC